MRTRQLLRSGDVPDRRPDDAFGALSHELRLLVLDVLERERGTEAFGAEQLPYSELVDRVRAHAPDDPGGDAGNFSYAERSIATQLFYHIGGRDAHSRRKGPTARDRAHGNDNRFTRRRHSSGMDWRLIPEERLGGPLAMALDEVAAETVAAGGPATVRLYRWTPSTVSLGYGTDAAVVDRAYCSSAGIDVTRRQTGGGAIYHDASGDVAYSIVAPRSAFPGGVTDCYRELLEPVLAAFEAVGADVSFADADAPALWEPLCYLRALDPAHDLVGPDGRKVAGNAQHRTREAVVQHGSLTFEADPEAHLAAFVDPPVDADAFADRVGGLSALPGVDSDRAAFVEELESALSAWAGAEAGAWTDAERERAAELCKRKYADDGWVRGREDPT